MLCYAIGRIPSNAIPVTARGSILYLPLYATIQIPSYLGAGIVGIGISRYLPKTYNDIFKLWHTSMSLSIHRNIIAYLSTYLLDPIHIYFVEESLLLRRILPYYWPTKHDAWVFCKIKKNCTIPTYMIYTASSSTIGFFLTVYLDIRT